MQKTLDSTRASVVDTLHDLGTHATDGFNHTSKALGDAVQIVFLTISLLALTVAGLAVGLGILAKGNPLPVKIKQ